LGWPLLNNRQLQLERLRTAWPVPPGMGKVFTQPGTVQVPPMLALVL
jgi:hypothetical protein